jgi:glycosyltransferase involved in cell wall biosynthesis
MKIIHIQASMPPSGNAAYRLSSAMRDCGIDSCILNLYPSAIKDNAFYIKPSITIKLFRFLDKVIKRYRKRYYKTGSYFYNSMPLFGIDISKHFLVQNADVIYIHWISGCLSYKNWLQLANMGKPIFVFMHDMWPFTGGCNHSMGCMNYMSNCKDCGMFRKNNSSVSYQLQIKRKIYSHSNIFFISPSKWMMTVAQKSVTMHNKVVFNIPNIVDETIFKPTDKITARMKLNLPKEKKIIIFGCQAGQNNPFKGWIYLEKAINMLKRNDILVVIYGSDYNRETEEKVKYPIRFLGKIEDENLLALICNSADIFVTPSLCENYSLTILENLLCGIPVVGFDTTGIPEMVKTGETGYLAKYKDAEDLARGMEILLSNKQIVNFRDNYSSKSIVEKHIKLIKDIGMVDF